MVYGGLVNKKIVAKLQSLHCNAIGITGADANLLPAKKRGLKALSPGEGLGEAIDYGWAGDIETEKVDPRNWKIFLEHGLNPVVASLTHDGNGNILNTNADTIASVIAVSLSKYFEVNLIFCFEKNGVLLDVDDENSVIAKMNHEEYESLKKMNKLFAGILPKIDNSFDAVNKGVKEVVIGNSSQLAFLINRTGGTKLSL
jgi:acetylglutamate kinase